MKSVSWDFTVDWRKLRLLHELDRRGTIAATAEALHLTPSAVSQQLAGLARDIGVPLLERGGRAVVRTGQARVLLSHADRMRERAERTRADLDAWAHGTVGHVRVGSLSTGITALVGPAMARLQQHRPGLAVQVSERVADEALALLDAGELEIQVTVDYPGGPAQQDARYHRTDLITDVMDAVVPAGHPLAPRPGAEWAARPTRPGWARPTATPAATSSPGSAPRPASPRTSATSAASGTPSRPWWQRASGSRCCPARPRRCGRATP